MYRDIFAFDDTFIFPCTPNDTHNCYLKAYVKNGVITRIGPSQRYRDATDLYGTKVSARWDPRICNKGIAIAERFYGDRRVKYPLVRSGFKQWVDHDFPRGADGRPPLELFNRGEDTWVRVSWDEAYELIAKAMIDIARTYSGGNGANLLRLQQYDEKMIEKMGGAGVRAMKFRGGMPLLGMIKLFGAYRLANSMALLDSFVRGVGADEAVGGTGFDNYTWHTDLPPGHPMVTGQQTVEFDLANVEHSNIVICWGMNWICTKMPDAHWLTEARLKGTKIVVITTDYNCTSSKADEMIILRPGTDPAFALGLAQVIMTEELYDRDFVKGYTDLPFLVNMNSRKLLRATEVIPGYQNAELTVTNVVKKGERAPAPFATNVDGPTVTETMRDEWGDFVVWDRNSGKPAAVSRDDIGDRFTPKGLDPALDGEFNVTLTTGENVKVRPIFDLIKQHLTDTWDVESTSNVTWASKDAIVNLARALAANPQKVLFTTGMGPNQMFNGDLKDRAIFLVASLTKNVGFFGGNVGSYAGNYRAALFNGTPHYIAEDPFNITLDPSKPANVKTYFAMQSAHFYAHGDSPLKVHGKYFLGNTHMPFPTKFLMFAGSNSLLGNAKGHYDLVMNLLRNRKIETLVVNEWWWTASCEYADIVLPVDSWGEYNVHDLTASVTNPFVMVAPISGIPRIYDTRGDVETYMGISEKLADITGNTMFRDYWKFIKEDKAKTYLQRIIDHSNATKGYDVEDMLAKARDGIPVLIMTRTYPKFVGYEQSVESQPWYNKTGRLEFYREEDEFLDYGENLPVYREPIDATFHEPNAIIAKSHPLINPKTPEDYGWPSSDLSGETRQVRNVVRTPDEIVKTSHPLMEKGFTHIYLTPKFRHSVHSFNVDTSILSVWFGPFGDMYRRDTRMPWVNEGYVEINPKDAKDMGIEDGDYIWCDPDPEDRPFKGWEGKPSDYKVARCMLRAKYSPNHPKGVSKTWFNMYQATHGSVRGHETREDGLARNPNTNYQAMFRYGGHQSSTRSWLRPTLMTDTLVRKELMGQVIGKGFSPDVHCANGAPRESFVKFTKAEDGGINGGKWRPAKLGLRVGYENDAMNEFLRGGFISTSGE